MQPQKSYEYSNVHLQSKSLKASGVESRAHPQRLCPHTGTSQQNRSSSMPCFREHRQQRTRSGKRAQVMSAKLPLTAPLETQGVVLLFYSLCEGMVHGEGSFPASQPPWSEEEHGSRACLQSSSLFLQSVVKFRLVWPCCKF